VCIVFAVSSRLPDVNILLSTETELYNHTVLSCSRYTCYSYTYGIILYSCI